MASNDSYSKNNFLDEILLTGKIWKLEWDTYRGPEDINSWERSFMRDFEPDDRLFIKECMIT